MKANLKNTFGVAALGMALLSTTVPTWAGRVSTDSVRVSSNAASRYAYGNMVDARYSADNIQNIGCIAETLRHYSMTSCYATDSAGRSLYCSSAENKFLEMVHGMTDSSYIYFETTDGTSNPGICRNIRIYDSSEMLR